MFAYCPECGSITPEHFWEDGCTQEDYDAEVQRCPVCDWSGLPFPYRRIACLNINGDESYNYVEAEDWSEE